MEVRRRDLAPLLPLLTTVPISASIPEALHLSCFGPDDATVVLCFPAPPQEKKHKPL